MPKYNVKHVLLDGSYRSDAAFNELTQVGLSDVVPRAIGKDVFSQTTVHEKR